MRRELDEELGLHVDEIGPHIWTRTHVIPFLDGRWDGQRDHVYLVRAPAGFTPVAGADVGAAAGRTAPRAAVVDGGRAAGRRRRRPALRAAPPARARRRAGARRGAGGRARRRRCVTASPGRSRSISMSERVFERAIQQVTVFGSVAHRSTSGGRIVARIEGAPMSDDDTLQAIREAVRAVCSRFDDDYWSACDQDHRFPDEFYAAMAAGGWIGIAIPERYGGGGQGIREAATVLEEVAASGACMNGASALHLSIFGMHPVVLHGTEEMKQRYLPDVADGQPARRLRRDRARRRHRHDPHHDPGRARRRPLRHQRAQGVDVEGARGRPHPAADPHHAARGVRQADARHDAVPGRPPRRRRRRSGRSPRWAATPWPRARRPTTTCWCRSTTGSARRAGASSTCSTGSTPSAS